MNWTELCIFTSTEGSDILCGCLLGIGINGFVVRDSKDFEEFLENKTGNWDYIDDDLMNLKDCETSVTVYLPDNAQGKEMFDSIKSELSRLKEIDEENAFGRLEYEFKNVCEEDWANNWKQYFKPLCVGDKLLIKPSWEEAPADDNRIILEIDPASSFGTGQHNTTQLCLELLEKNINGNEKVLDLGCGSGILSIAAILLGADYCTAVDIDENSVKIAKENAEKNNIPKEKYTAYCGNVITDNELVKTIGNGYKIVVANIVADVLIGMSDLFSDFLTDDGILIMSGIIVERKDEVIEAVENQGFRVISVAEKDGWAAVSMKK
ncbi:MAG: 50S ribosomal protein L11 methyltransferase [Oscillospiraceae bacterium]|nr:50S ribosomal protein L11 methyltransferase [Oscillospiraceae bacterium]MBR6695481.1 50S ribosomal protein L11 methyltransferase [Oscillospiraceae bacterium]